MMRQKHWVAVVCTFVLSWLSTSTLAETGINIGTVESFQLNLEQLVAAWRPRLQIFATDLLFALTGISIAWQAILMVIKTPSLQDFFSAVVRIILFAGFFLAVIRYSADWTEALIESFTQAAAEALSDSQKRVSLSSADTLRLGIRLAIQMIEGSWFNLVAMLLLAAPVMVIHALMAGYQLLVLAEMYVVTAAGVLLLGFGGSNWTMDYARRYIQYCVSIGAKLFTLYLMVGLSHQVYGYIIKTTTWSAASGLAALGTMILIALLVCSLPGMVQKIINGAHSLGEEGTGRVSVPTGYGTQAATVVDAARTLTSTSGRGREGQGVNNSGLALRAATQSARQLLPRSASYQTSADSLEKLRQLQASRARSGVRMKRQ